MPRASQMQPIREQEAAERAKAPPKGKPRKRPPITQELTLALCDRLAAGKPLYRICQDPKMPSLTEVYVRMAHDEAFGELIHRARAAQQHAMVDQTIELADSATPADWQVKRLQIWSRQWVASKLQPRFYGDRMQTEVSGGLTVEAVRSEDSAALRAGLMAGLIAAGVAPAIARAVVSAAEQSEGELIEGVALPAPDKTE
jgi:hypothetical protein